MNDFLCSGKERMKLWRDFRRDLEQYPEGEQLQMLARFWGEAPLVDYVIDWDYPEQWPTPWELLYEGDFCRSTIALMMEQTLLCEENGPWTTDRLELQLMRDPNMQVQHIILVVDGKWVLNYDFQEVVDINEMDRDIVIEHKYRASDKGHFIVN